MKEIIINGIKYAYIGLILEAISVSFLSAIGVKFKETEVSEMIRSLDTNMLFIIVIFGPLIEELIFRMLPIEFAKKLGKILRINEIYKKRFVWIIILVSSFIFGYLHGGLENVFVQGIGGIVLSLAYLKGGLETSFVAHSFSNLVVVISIIIF